MEGWGTPFSLHFGWEETGWLTPRGSAARRMLIRSKGVPHPSSRIRHPAPKVNSFREREKLARDGSSLRDRIPCGCPLSPCGATKDSRKLSEVKDGSAFLTSEAEIRLRLEGRVAVVRAAS